MATLTISSNDCLRLANVMAADARALWRNGLLGSAVASYDLAISFAEAAGQPALVRVFQYSLRNVTAKNDKAAAEYRARLAGKVA